MMQRFPLRAAPILVLLVLILLIIVLTPPVLDVGPTGQYSNSSAQTASPALDRRIVENQNQGRVIQTLYQIEALAARTGWSADLRRLAGDVWEQIGDLPAAVSFWEASDALRSDDQDAVRKLAQAYVTLTRWPDAAEALRRLIELSPRDPWAHYQLGLLLAASDPRTAAGHLEAASVSPAYEQVADAVRAVISQQPADDLLPMRVGVALAEYELWPYAEVAFRQAVAVGRPLADALAYVGLSRDRQAKDGGAWIEQALVVDPQNPRVHYAQGLHLRSVGAYEDSLASLLEAAALEPDNPAFQADVGTAYHLLGDVREAERWLKSAVVASDGDPDFQTELALFYADEAPSLTAEGLKALEQTIASVPENADALAGYGWALHILGETERGLAEIDRALELAPGNPRALFYKASIWLEGGQTEDAVPLLRQVAESPSPFAVQAQRVLTNLGH